MNFECNPGLISLPDGLRSALKVIDLSSLEIEIRERLFYTWRIIVLRKA